MRVGTHTALGRKWTPVGVRPTGRQKIGYEYLYLYVSVEPNPSELFAMFLPRLDNECFNLFAGQRALSLKRKILMVADGATAHRRQQQALRLLAYGVKSQYHPCLNYPYDFLKP